MASSSSSSPPSMPQNHGFFITQDEFFAFHNMDRKLFSRLVFHLRHEPAEAMQVGAFWLWLERINRANSYVKKIIAYPDDILEAVFEETLGCLKAAERDVFTSPDDPHDTPLIQSIVGSERICLRYFYENRINVLRGVGNIVQEVCLRAFQDLMRVLLACRPVEPLPNYFSNNQNFTKPVIRSPLGGGNDGGDGGAVGGVGRGGVGGLGVVPQPPPQMAIYNQNVGQGVNMFHHPTVKVGELSVPLRSALYLGPSQGVSSNSGASSSNNPPLLPNPNYDVGIQGDVAELLARMSLNERFQFGEDISGDVPSSERTIFLTFSKGYPITEIELREFLNRSFGDIIEALYMQDVGENEQPLYARLVVRDLNAMVAVLGGQSKPKFAINGKHVWARKYVRKNPNSPPSSPS